jgi:hypothetical protein
VRLVTHPDAETRAAGRGESVERSQHVGQELVGFNGMWTAVGVIGRLESPANVQLSSI